MEPHLVVCPESKAPLQRLDIEWAEQHLFAGSVLEAPKAVGHTPVGRTGVVYARTDGVGAYPVRDGFPVLLAPEMLVPAGNQRAVDVTQPPYAAAYADMEHYSQAAYEEAGAISSSPILERLQPLGVLDGEERATFPDPPMRWLDTRHDIAAQWDAYRHLAPLEDARVLQLGGRGVQAVTMLLAGAREAWLVTPMVGELVFASALAAQCGVGDRLQCAVGLAEELPFASQAFDVVYSQGCVHHWVTDLAIPECARVLKPGGRFAAVEPWRGPFYSVGTRLLGKRDPHVGCIVLTSPRIEPQLRSAFSDVTIAHHGALTRYPLLALWKTGVSISRRTAWWVARFDDAITARYPSVRDRGSSVALLAERPA